MNQNINIKDAKVGLRKALVPVGIITAILGLIFIVLHCSGIATTDINIQDKMTKIARYVAMSVCFLALALTALMLTHGIMQLAKLKKGTVKWEITSGIINTIVGILLFVSFFVIILTVFDNAKWWASVSETTGKYNIWMNCSFMGIITALSIYVVCFGKHFNTKGLENKNTDIKMLRVIGVSTLVISICNIVPIALTMLGGFISKESLTEQSKALNLTASSYAVKFALAGIGTVALGVLCMIPLAILGLNDKVVAKKNIIMWSVVGGIALILFIIPAAMMSLDHGFPKSWFGLDEWESDPKNVVITVFTLISGICSIVAGAMASAKTKSFLAAKAA